METKFNELSLNPDRVLYVWLLQTLFVVDGQGPPPTFGRAASTGSPWVERWLDHSEGGGIWDMCITSGKAEPS